MKIKKLLVLAIFAIAIVGIIAPMNASNIDNDIKIESKAKTASYKITWNGNGGKIGTKKIVSMTVKKGTKIGKLPQTPKRTDYAFQGWYTKKTGGTKITKNTKPKKSATLYAQWIKKSSSRVLNSEEKKLVGQWKFTWDGSSVYKFNADGTYFLVRALRDYDAGFKGYYSVKNGILTLRYQHTKDYTGVGFSSKSLLWGDWETSTMPIEFWTEDGEQYVKISLTSYVKS